MMHGLHLSAGGKEAEREQPVHKSTCVEDIPEVEPGTAMKEFLVRLMGLRATNPPERIFIHTLYVKSAFRQIPVDPAGASAFSYVVTDLVVEHRLQVGFKGSLRWFALMASAIEDERRRTTQSLFNLSPAEIKTTKRIQIAPPSGKWVMPVPAPCGVQEVDGAGAEDPA